LKCTSQVDKTRGREENMSWHDTGMDVATRKRVMRIRAFGDSGFASLKCASSLPPRSPMCDELRLLGASPYQLDHSPYDLSLCDHGQNSHRASAFLMTRCLCPRDLRFPETRWFMAVDLSTVRSWLQSLPPVFHY
jgi:hypothetical protein